MTHDPAAAQTPEAPRYDPQWVTWAIERLDQLRAELSDIAGAMPNGDARDSVVDAKNDLALAQDLIEVENG